MAFPSLRFRLLYIFVQLETLRWYSVHPLVVCTLFAFGTSVLGLCAPLSKQEVILMQPRLST